MSDLIMIVVAAAAVAFVADRTVFARGRLSGFKEASDESIRGLVYHYQHDKKASELVLKALNEIKARLAKKQPARMTCNAVGAVLCELGRAIGDVAFRKGFEAGREAQERFEPATIGKIRVDLSISELMQIRWLAHFGFEHTMWNTGDPEGAKPRSHTHTVFKDRLDAQRATEAIDMLESRIPKGRGDSDEPYALSLNRQQMIRERWRPKPGQ
jgi:hypothetical protein